MPPKIFYNKMNFFKKKSLLFYGICEVVMKKIFICLILGYCLSANCSSEAHHCHHYSYVTHRDYYSEPQYFVNCDRHSVLKETTVYFYSNGTRRSYSYSTIYNKDGSILESGCSNVKHFISNNQHYFTFYKNGRYQIINETGEVLSTKKYKSMLEVSPNKLLVKYDRKYGIIDLNENIIIPIKYKKFKQIKHNLFLTKLNGYYGICDSSNNIFVKNEYDSIKQINECYLLKKQNKYGLTNSDGKIILEANYDQIKALGEYIIIKMNDKYGILDSDGNIIANPIYKKIRLERNNLEGKLNNKTWEKIK